MIYHTQKHNEIQDFFGLEMFNKLFTKFFLIAYASYSCQDTDFVEISCGLFGILVTILERMSITE